MHASKLEVVTKVISRVKMEENLPSISISLKIPFALWVKFIFANVNVLAF